MSRTRAHFRLSTTAGRRRVLPVRAWLQAGAAAAAVGFALAGAATASADDGTAARDSSSAARDSSTQSRVSASSSAPRASAAQAKSRVALAVAPQRALAGAPGRQFTGTGKALFNDSGKVIQTPQIYKATVSRYANPSVHLVINDPAFALWSKPQTILRTDSAKKYAFPEWLHGGPGRAPINANPDEWAKNTLTGVRQRLDTAPFGVFDAAFQPVGSIGGATYTNGDGVAVTRYFGDVQNSFFAPPRPFGKDANGVETRRTRAAYDSLLSALATITPQTACASNKPRCNEILLANGNDVVMPGWIGNAVIDTGAGDDVILASPQVNVAVYFGNSSYSWPNSSPSAQIYYPTPYALRGGLSNKEGNIFSGGPGKDLIYYDGSVAGAYGGDGDDILAPSFGSFNWAFDSLIQGTWTGSGPDGLRQTADYLDKRRPLSGYGGPLPVYRAAGNTGIFEGRAVVSGPKALLGPDTDLRRGLSPDPENRASYSFQFYQEPRAVNRFNIGLNGDPAGGKPTIDNEINKLGGQDLYGGAGDDIIYGTDPDFYKGFQTAANGKGIRRAFNNPNPKDGKVDGRGHAQMFETVNMFGGTGGDYFALGNPRNVDPAVWGQYSTKLYRISGNSDSFKLKNTNDFGVLEGDVFEVNLTYKGANWTDSVVGPDGAGVGGQEIAGKVVKGGVDGLKVTKDLLKEFKVITANVFPQFTAVASLVGYVSGLVLDNVKPDPETPIEDDTPFYSDPIGTWLRAIEIQDWDPADSITLRVDPSNSQSDKGRRWANVKFAYAPSTDSSNAGALTITAQLSDEEAPRDLIILEQFTQQAGSTGGWWAWDFRAARGQGAYVPITSEHMGFFGQVDPFKAKDVLRQNNVPITGYIDQFNFNVAADSTLFRWTDTGLKNFPGDTREKLLNDLRSNSERIVFQLDTMKLGYHFDIQYLGQASGPNNDLKNLKVDQKASKLWVAIPGAAEGGKDQWISYSLEELEANPELAKLAKKATPVWTGPSGNPNLPAT